MNISVHIDRGLAYAELLRIRNEYREFMLNNWDKDKNRMRVEALDGFYDIFRNGVRARIVYDECLRRINKNI